MYAIAPKAAAIAARNTLQAPTKGLGAAWRQANYRAPSLRNGAITALVQAANNGVVTQQAALAALQSVPLGSGTPRSFLVAFVKAGYLVPQQAAPAQQTALPAPAAKPAPATKPAPAAKRKPAAK